MADRKKLIAAALAAVAGGAILAKEGPEGLARFAGEGISTFEGIRQQRTREAQTAQQRRLQERALSLDEERNAREAEKILTQKTADKEVGRISGNAKNVINDPLSKEGGYLTDAARTKLLEHANNMSVFDEGKAKNLMDVVDRLSKPKDPSQSLEEEFVDSYLAEKQSETGQPLSPLQVRQATEEAHHRWAIAGNVDQATSKYQYALKLGMSASEAKQYALSGESPSDVKTRLAMQYGQINLEANPAEATRYANDLYDFIHGVRPLPPEEVPAGKEEKGKETEKPKFDSQAAGEAIAKNMGSSGIPPEMLNPGGKAPEKAAAASQIPAGKSQSPSFNSIDELKSYLDANVKDEKLKQRLLSEGGRRFKVKKKAESQK